MPSGTARPGAPCQPIARSACPPRCSATDPSPSSAAMTAATFLDVQTPPSSGGVFSRSRSVARTSGVRIVALAPLPCGDLPARTGRRRCSGPATPRSSAARSSSAVPSRRRCAPAPRARSPGGAAPASRPRRRIPHPQLRHAQMVRHPCHAHPLETAEQDPERLEPSGESPAHEAISRRRYHLLPGEDAPERVVFSDLESRHWNGIPDRLGRRPSEAIDALNNAMSSQHHHEWVDSVGDMLTLGGEVVWQALCSAWAADCLVDLEYDRVSSVIEDALSGNS